MGLIRSAESSGSKSLSESPYSVFGVQWRGPFCYFWAGTPMRVFRFVMYLNFSDFSQLPALMQFDSFPVVRRQVRFYLRSEYLYAIFYGIIACINA